MKAVIQEGYGAPDQVLRVSEVDKPSVRDDEVLIRMRATSVNTPDWITVTGVPHVLRLRFGLWNPRTAVRGIDLAGIVESVGEKVTEFKQGDEVFGNVLIGPGYSAMASSSHWDRLLRSLRISSSNSPIRASRSRTCASASMRA